MIEDIKTGLVSLGLPAPSDADVLGRRWTTIIDQYEPIDRWRAFGVLSDHLTAAEYGVGVRHIWTHSEGDFDESQFDTVFFPRGQVIEHQLIMTEDERRCLDGMPDPIRVFRGCQEDTRDGVCWSVDPDCARKFAKRAAGECADGKGLVLVGECLKSDVIAFFDTEGLHESEILTKHVRSPEIYETVTVEDDE